MNNSTKQPLTFSQFKDRVFLSIILFYIVAVGLGLYLKWDDAFIKQVMPWVLIACSAFFALTLNHWYRLYLSVFAKDSK